MKNEERERVAQVVSMAKLGASVCCIRIATRMRHGTVIAILKEHGAYVPNDITAAAIKYADKIAKITDEQWHRWAVTRASLRAASIEVGIPRDNLSKHAHKVGRVWWSGTGRPPSSEAKDVSRKLRAVAYTDTPTVEPTRQDYADLCDREFATPHFLRKAPAMLARIEAMEAREKREQKEREERRTARTAKVARMALS